MPRCVLPGILLAATLAGCTVFQPPPPTAEVAAFSLNREGSSAPRHWQPLTITRAKAPTQYRLVYDEQAHTVVVHARSQRSATGLKQLLDVDPAAKPRVAWRWRVQDLIAGADNLDRHAEDSPVRLLLFFDGDKRRLPPRDQVALEMAEMVSGQSVPYATLVYLWENRQPVGTVIDSAHTGRIKMVVAGSGRDRLGQWKHFERDYVADFQRAFGERPGRLIGVGIMTDTDNTGTEIEAFYGDIELRTAS
jgi:Protein of unknown function (DUF3047)